MTTNTEEREEKMRALVSYSGCPIKTLIILVNLNLQYLWWFITTFGFQGQFCVAKILQNSKLSFVSRFNEKLPEILKVKVEHSKNVFACYLQDTLYILN